MEDDRGNFQNLPSEISLQKDVRLKGKFRSRKDVILGW